MLKVHSVDYNAVAIFIRLEICKIPRNSPKIRIYSSHGHLRPSILVSIESACATSY